VRLFTAGNKLVGGKPPEGTLSPAAFRRILERPEAHPEGLPGETTGQLAAELIPNPSFFIPWKHETTVVG